MSDEFPFIGTEQVSTTDNLPLAREYAWSFDTDKFIYDNSGNHVLVEGNEAIKVWIYKALKTDRNSYLAYSAQFGIELEPFIGKVMQVQERESELKRVIVECLMVNPYIQSIDKINFELVKEKMTCSIDLTTIYGELNVIV